MPIDEQKLRALLSEQEEKFERHVGVLVEESDRKFELIQEGFQGLTDKMDQLREEFIAIRKEIEEIRLHLFRKADLDRLEALEQRVSVLEKRALRG